MKQTKTFISQQMGIYAQDEAEEEDEGIAPEDVEFNMIAAAGGQPNGISAEERKMIEMAIRESEHQERQARQAQRASHQQPPQNHKKQPQQMELQEESEVKDGDVAKAKKKNKQSKKVNKKDGNNCCTIF